MKITATRVNEHSEVEYTVIPTIEERNWVAVYENMKRNLFNPDMRKLDEFATEALYYDPSKCRSFTWLLKSWLEKLGETPVDGHEPLYGTVLTYDEIECLRAYRHMKHAFSKSQVDALNVVIDSVLKYRPSSCDLMLDVMEQAAELIDDETSCLKVKAY